MKRLLTFIMAIVLVSSLASQAIAAAPNADNTCEQTGDGSKKLPFVICNYGDFQLVRLNPSAYFELGQDLDLSFLEWVPIDSFSGVIDGNNHEILGFRGMGNGLFRRIEAGGVVKNLRIESASIRGDSKVGAIAGLNFGIIDNVEVQGTSITGLEHVGTIAGYNNGIIRNSRTLFYVWVTTTSGGGGIVGSNDVNGVINESSTDKVSIIGDALLGGIAGVNSGKIKKSSAKGVIYAATTGPAYVGGIVGDNKIGGKVQKSEAEFNIYRRSNEFVGFVYGRNEGHVTNSTGYGQLLPY
ncbi:M26 family metallopeptidase [Cohnella cholangitidis]|uniref:GLUG domain-containing protein n=1 Tax=Cohnella cholangitidis TaxID=2598458 RepID=A0A7G5C6D7_9BACL|nr:hypothetical protein [Cohnella cholangitidis]QMV44771.1 hypothetical protein FPL14_29100 [Cohnella cholangitidis]